MLSKLLGMKRIFHCETVFFTLRSVFGAVPLCQGEQSGIAMSQNIFFWLYNFFRYERYIQCMTHPNQVECQTDSMKINCMTC